MPPTRTLYIMLNCDFPPRSATPQRIWRTVTALSKLGPVAVFSIGHNNCTDSTLPGVQQWHHVEPPWRGRIPRLYRVLELLLRQILRLIFPAQYTGFDFALEKKANRELRQFIADFQPTVAVLDHWLKAVIPSPLRKRDFPLIVASHDVEWQLLRDMIDPKTSRFSRMAAKARIRYFRWLEARLYRGADRTWTVSDRDRRAIGRFTGLTSKVRALPIVTEIDYFEPVRRKTMAWPRSRSARGPVIFYAGGYWWEPNADAAHTLIADMYPLLRTQFPGTRLMLIGRSPTSQMQAAAHADENIVVTGEVDDIRPYLSESDVVAVPLLIGGGMRSKIIEAFAAGVPVVSTTKGAEGIDAIDERELLVRDGVPAFVAGIKKVWNEPQLARELAERGYEFVRRDYSMEAMEMRVRAELDELIAMRTR